MPDRHPSSQRLHELLKLCGELHDDKQQDYGRDDDPFANVRASEEWDVPGWVGALIRLTDKVRRLQSLATKGHLKNEAAIDSFMDIAVYALIARILYEEQAETSGEYECLECGLWHDEFVTHGEFVEGLTKLVPNCAMGGECTGACFTDEGCPTAGDGVGPRIGG